LVQTYTIIIREHGGAGLIDHYDDSVHKMLCKVFPEYNWDRLQFSQAPQKYWHNMNNQKAHLETLAKRLNIKKLDDWNHVTSIQFYQAGGAGLLARYKGSVIRALQANYPETTWHRYRFTPQRGKATTSKQQLYLFKHLRNLFTGVTLHLNYKIPCKLDSPIL